MEDIQHEVSYPDCWLKKVFRVPNVVWTNTGKEIESSFCVLIWRKYASLLPKWIFSIIIVETIAITRLSCDSTKRYELQSHRQWEDW